MLKEIVGSVRLVWFVVKYLPFVGSRVVRDHRQDRSRIRN